MLFYPDLCLSCVIDLHTNGENKWKKHLTCMAVWPYISVTNKRVIKMNLPEIETIEDMDSQM